MTGSGLKAHCCCDSKKEALASINDRENLEHLRNRHISMVDCVPLTSVRKLIWYWANFEQNGGVQFLVILRHHSPYIRGHTSSCLETQLTPSGGLIHTSLYIPITLLDLISQLGHESRPFSLSCLPQRTRIPSDTPQADSELSPVWSPLNITSFTSTRVQGSYTKRLSMLW